MCRDRSILRHAEIARDIHAIVHVSEDVDLATQANRDLLEFQRGEEACALSDHAVCSRLAPPCHLMGTEDDIQRHQGTRRAGISDRNTRHGTS